MADDLHSDEYRTIVRALREIRQVSGVQQGELSTLIGKPRNYINRIEAAERRLGLVDLFLIANALGHDPAELFRQITDDLKASKAG